MHAEARVRGARHVAGMSRSQLLTLLSLACAAYACHSPTALGIDAGLAARDAAAPPDARVLDDAASALDAGLEPLPAPWVREPSYPQPVDHHTTSIVQTPAGAFLYVVGGIEADSRGQPVQVYSAVRRARIAADGSLGAWEDEGALPRPLAFHATLTMGRSVVLAGGLSSDGSGALGWVASLLSAEVDDEGHLSAWTVHPDRVGGATLHGQLVAMGERAYLVGGGAGAIGLSAAVRSYALARDRDGALTLGEPRDEASLPFARSHHIALAFGGHLWVVAGLAEGGDAAIVHRSVSMEGAPDVLVGWEEVGSLADPPATASLVYLEPSTLWLVGGASRTGFSARVRTLGLDESGAAPGEDALELPIARGHVHQTPTQGRWLYSVGGRVLEGRTQRSTSDVYRAALPD